MTQYYQVETRNCSARGEMNIKFGRTEAEIMFNSLKLGADQFN